MGSTRCTATCPGMKRLATASAVRSPVRVDSQYGATAMSAADSSASPPSSLASPVARRSAQWWRAGCSCALSSVVYLLSLADARTHALHNPLGARRLCRRLARPVSARPSWPV